MLKWNLHTYDKYSQRIKSSFSYEVKKKSLKANIVFDRFKKS